MEKNSLYFLTIVCCGFLVMAYIKDKIDYFDSRLMTSIAIIQELNSKNIDSITNSKSSDSLLRVINNNDIQKESYMDMLDRESDWFIAFVSILFGIFAIVGYSFFRLELLSIKEQSSKEIEEYHKNYGIHNNEFNDLKRKLYKTIGTVQTSTAKQYFKSFPALSFIASLNGAKFINLAYDLNKDENKKDEKFTISNLESALSALNKIRLQDDIIKFRHDIKKYEDDAEKDFTDLFKAKRIEVKSKCAEVRVAFDLLMTIDLRVDQV